MESSEICNYQIGLQQSHSNRSDTPVLMNVISKHRMRYLPTCPCSSGYGWNKRCLLNSLFREEPSQCNDAQLISERVKQAQFIQPNSIELSCSGILCSLQYLPWLLGYLYMYLLGSCLTRTRGSWRTHERCFSIERADVRIYKLPCCWEWVPPIELSL